MGAKDGGTVPGKMGSQDVLRDTAKLASSNALLQVPAPEDGKAGMEIRGRAAAAAFRSLFPTAGLSFPGLALSRRGGESQAPVEVERSRLTCPNTSISCWRSREAK